MVRYGLCYCTSISGGIDLAKLIHPISVQHRYWEQNRTNHIKSFLSASSCLFSRGTIYSANGKRYSKPILKAWRTQKLTTSSGIHERLLIFFVSLSPLQDADQGTVLENQVKWIDHKVQWTRHLKSFSQSVKYRWFIASISKYEKKKENNWPIPSTAAMAWTFSTASLFSICTITRMSRFADSK